MRLSIWPDSGQRYSEVLEVARHAAQTAAADVLTLDVTGGPVLV